VRKQLETEMPIRFTKPAELAFSKTFKGSIADIYCYFPELWERNVTCGAIRHRGTVQGVATGWTEPPLFRLVPGASLYTVAHELTHLVQGSQSGIPHGETACDIWTIDRMPIRYLDQAPFYLLSGIRIDWQAKREAVKAICKQAIDLRQSRGRYIKWLRCRLKELQSSSGIS
jgi:hypothetical protein